MSYREITHIALSVRSLREAEEFYRGLFGMEEGFRSGGGKQVPPGATWEEIEAAGIPVEIVMLYRGPLRLALGPADEVNAGGILNHIGLEVAQDELERLRTEGPARGCRIPYQRDDLVVLVDPLGVQWELTSRHYDDPRAMARGHAWAPGTS